MAANLLSPNFGPHLSLFKRCVQCPNEAPTCPSCKSDEVCTTTIGDCNSCAVARCQTLSASGTTATTTPSANNGPNVAAIAGGVVGGVAGIVIIVFLLWKFWFKGRRRPVEEFWEEDEGQPEKPNGASSFMQMRDARSSTHTVASLASTVLTRASNIIQIAYIPGVTNRNTQSPGLLVPPVPPIPIPTTPSTVSHFEGEQRFFVPELRDSTFSDTSSMMADMQRRSIASSLARSSIGTTIYKDDAVAHPMPATTIVRGMPKVVSVKSTGSNSNIASPAETPQTEKGEFSRQVSGASTATSRPVIVKMLGSSDSLRPSAFGSQKSGVSSITGKSMKPVALNITRKGSKGSKGPTSAPADNESAREVTPEAAESVSGSLRQPLETIPSRPVTGYSVADSVATDISTPHSRARASVAHSHQEDDESSDDDEAHERSRQSLLKGKQNKETKSPFDDDALIEDDKSSGKAELDDRNKSPFEDDNAV